MGLPLISFSAASVGRTLRSSLRRRSTASRSPVHRLAARGKRELRLGQRHHRRLNLESPVPPQSCLLELRGLHFSEEVEVVESFVEAGKSAHLSNRHLSEEEVALLDRSCEASAR